MYEIVERWAMRIAVGNNGGDWDTRYTEKHKALWRERARAFIAEIWAMFERSERGEGYTRIGKPDEAEFGPRPSVEEAI